MKKLLLPLLFIFGACTHAPYGAYQLRSGSKIVDKGIDRTYQDYIEVYSFIKEHCKNDVGCMRYWGISQNQYDEMSLYYSKVKKHQKNIQKESEKIQRNIDIMEIYLDNALNSESNIMRRVYP